MPFTWDREYDFNGVSLLPPIFYPDFPVVMVEPTAETDPLVGDFDDDPDSDEDEDEEDFLDSFDEDDEDDFEDEDEDEDDGYGDDA